MIRKDVKSFTEYQDAKEYADTLEGNVQIRRRAKSFVVVKRIEGISKWSEIKVSKTPNKRKRKKRNVAYEF